MASLQESKQIIPAFENITFSKCLLCKPQCMQLHRLSKFQPDAALFTGQLPCKQNLMKLSGKVTKPRGIMKGRHPLTSLIFASVSSGRSHKLALGQNILYENLFKNSFLASFLSCLVLANTFSSFSLSPLSCFTIIKLWSSCHLLHPRMYSEYCSFNLLINTVLLFQNISNLSSCHFLPTWTTITLTSLSGDKTLAKSSGELLHRWASVFLSVLTSTRL